MAELSVVRPEQANQWMAVLGKSSQYDFYHLPAYHALAEQRGEGKASLFVYAQGEHLIALPLLLRPVEAVSGLAQAGAGWWDATSVYGYAGPIASGADIPTPVIAGFQATLTEALRAQGVVAVFSRLHPLLPQRPFLAGMGECIPLGQTVSIDLTLPPEAQRAQYRQNHKANINRLVRLGVACAEDASLAHLGQFVALYHESMRRVGAAPYYFFDQGYFESLLSILEGRGHLFMCVREGQMICGGVFVLCKGIVQYHLGGTRDDALHLAPMKLVFDTVRLWANAQGARAFHLGGGLGAQEDSLFQFKAGFSKLRHEFETWRWVVIPEVYERLCAEMAHWNAEHRLQPTPDYFPAYRSPTVPLG
jgi:hypothetical protein